jgi:elongation factor P
MIAATQIKRGMTIKLNGELYRVFSFQHITPGNWRGMVQTKLKSLKTGSIIEHRFRSEDRVDQAYLETHEVEYLYSDSSDYYFMNTETFEQFHLPVDLLEDACIRGAPGSFYGTGSARRHCKQCQQAGDNGNRACDPGSSLY